MSKEKFIQDKISEETRKKVERKVAELKKEGFIFDYEETPDEFIVEKEGKRIHLTKVASPDIDTFPIMIEKAVKNNDYLQEADERIEKIIRK